MAIRAFILRALGALTILGSVLLGVVVLVPSTLRNSEAITYGSLGSIAVGLLVMIAHINATSVVSENEKTGWRRSLWWGGPFVAGVYLWVAGGRLLRRTDHERPAH